MALTSTPTLCVQAIADGLTGVPGVLSAAVDAKADQHDPHGVTSRGPMVESFSRTPVYFPQRIPKEISLSRIKKPCFWSKLRARGNGPPRTRNFDQKHGLFI